MAAFPPSPQIVGKHGGIFEAYYMQADPLGTGSIGAFDAANFLKRSKLSDAILSQVWDMSDPMGKGYLEKLGFFVALKLISLAQNKQDMNTSNLIVETPPPDLGPVEAVDPLAQTAHIANIPWDITLSEKSKYDKVFDSLQPVNNMLAGDKVKPVLMNSKLPVDILGRIWDMSDIDKDGCLDRDEFAVAMHLVYQAREGMETPTILRPGLVPPSKRKGAGLGNMAPHLPGAVPVLPISAPTSAGNIATWGRSTPPQGVTGTSWVVTPAEKASSDMIFSQLDTDYDGLVSGAEIRDIMAQSGLRTAVLAHIWGLCDSQSVGKLTTEQFALALYLIQQKLKGVEPPAQLTPEMIPPSLRSVSDPGAFGVRNGTNAGPYSHVADFSAIKELDQISKEIEDIKKEKLQLERDKAQQEADIKIRQSEVQVLQKEFDSLTGTLSQLESQKKEAQKRLDELEDKRSSLDRNVIELKDKTSIELGEVNKMKSLLNNRELQVKDQEAELDKLRAELAKLREEEAKLEQITDSSRQQLQQLASSQGEISSEIVMTKTRLQQIQSQNTGLDLDFNDFSGDILAATEVANITANASMNNFGTYSAVEEFKEDPFKDQDVFGGGGGGGALPDSQNDPFQNDDPFKESDPFNSTDPFASEDPFKDTFGDASASVKGEDMFAVRADPFTNLPPAEKTDDDFDAFGVNWDSSSAFSQPSDKAPSFTTDPFGAPSNSNFNAAKKKAPPPRPAPIKSKSPTPFGSMSSSPNITVQPLGGFDSDPFGGNDPFSSSGSRLTTGNSAADPFANFADFSPGKFSAQDDNDDMWNGGGPSTITIKNSRLAEPQLTKKNVKLNNTSSVYDDSEA